MATVKTALQNVAAGIGVKVPVSFIGNPNQDSRLLLRAASSAGRHLRSVHDWRRLTFEHTWVMQNQLESFPSLPDPTFHHVKPGTAFDRGMFRRMVGPLTASQWQRGEAVLVTAGLERRFRIRIDQDDREGQPFINFLDDPGAYTGIGAMEYVTDQWINYGSELYRSTIEADTDVPLFDDYLFEVECTWRTLKALGEPYFDEKDEAMRLCDRLYAQENGAQVEMRRSRNVLYPNVPETNYGL